MSRRYPEEVHEYIRDNVKGKSAAELAGMTNAEFGTGFTASSMKAYKANRKLRSGVPTGNKKGTARVFPEEVQDFIRKNVMGTSCRELTERVNTEFGTSYRAPQIKAYKGNHGLSSGLTGRFKKGHIPANKGKKGICASGSEKGWFRKGHVPANHKPVGSERIDVDGYVLVKTAEPNEWKLKHRLVWQEHNGEIPEGKIVTFLDGDKQNTHRGNLVLITNEENLEMNRSGLRGRDPELTRTGSLVARLTACKNQRKKELSN